jgi:hypothetical protein
MKVWNIQIASERSLQQRAATLVSNELIAEEAIFSFPLKSGSKELKPTPNVYVPHLKNKIFDLLKKNNKVVNDN